VQIAVITAPRKGADYLPQTMKDVFQIEYARFRVFSDSIDLPTFPEPPKHVQRYELLSVEVRTPEELALVQQQRAVGTYNLMRALDWLGAGEGGCVFEDDVQLTANFGDKVRALGEMAAKTYGRRWLLSLIHFYQPHDFANAVSPDDWPSLSLVQWKQPQNFYGAQGLAMPAEIAKEFGQCLRRARSSPIADVRGEWWGDFSVKAYCKHFCVPLLASHPCLIQHVGVVSTFAGTRPLATEHFQP
jgi:hypothetical protein